MEKAGDVKVKGEFPATLSSYLRPLQALTSLSRTWESYATTTELAAS